MAGAKKLARPLVFLGPPGAGKGTQARVVAERLGVPQISTGDMFRDHAARGTELGKKAKAIMEKGGLVPDEIVVGMVAERIRQAVAILPPERLAVNPDCGLLHLPRDVAFGKLCAMVEGASRARLELAG